MITLGLILESIILAVVLGLSIWLLIDVSRINSELDDTTRKPIIINGKLTPEKDINIELDKKLDIDVIKNLIESTKNYDNLVVKMWFRDGSQVHLSQHQNMPRTIDPFS